MLDSNAQHPAVIARAPALYASAFALGVVPRLLWPSPLLQGATAFATGVPLLVLGASLAKWTNRSFRQARTQPDPYAPTTTLVVDGPFAYSRNPSYLARTLMYVGLALALNMPSALATLIPLMVIVHFGIVKREERYLERRFGATYWEYRASVRRWL